MKTHILALLILICLNIFGQETPSKKYALVIGVKSYKHVTPLKNSLNDAQDMSALLRKKGFKVISVYEPKTKRQMQDSIVKYFGFLENNQKAAGLVYYSGHGMQVEGTNYLIPTDANPELKADLDDQCLNMDYIMRALEQAGNPLNIFVLDACRNNPFRSFSRSSETGLSMVNTPKGSYIVYATKPGSTASDGTERNGLFTSKLIKYINTPDLNIEQVFKRVAAEVSAASNDKQRPWIASDYTGDFYFSENSSATYKSTPIEVKSESKSTQTAADLYRIGKEYFDNKNYLEALKYLRSAAEQEDSDAQNQLGNMYFNGIWVDKDYKQAAIYYRLSADQGNSEAQHLLGTMYFEGQGVDKDYNQTLKYHRLSAEQGNATAQAKLGACYHKGYGVEKDYGIAVKYYLISAAKGNYWGQNGLGSLYHTGDGVEKDFIQAAKYYKMAADQGFPAAQTNLGSLYYQGFGVEKNYSQAIKYFRLAAEQGFAAAQNWVGFMYQNGYGVEKDYIQAVKYYILSAEQGYAAGQNSLGFMYGTGYGVEKDNIQAAKFYKLSAEQGCAGGQNNLGFMYQFGYGVEKNKVEAEKWYRKAAEQGNENAKKALKGL